MKARIGSIVKHKPRRKGAKAAAALDAFNAEETLQPGRVEMVN
jgi:hypothetical protein